MKRKIFLAFSYDSDSDRALANDVQSLVNSHNLETITGQNLGGGNIPQGVRDLILKCDGLVALLTRRHQLSDGNWTTHEWVKNEVNLARSENKKTVSLVEDRVQINGMFQAHEKIPYNKEDEMSVFLRLSDSLKIWKEMWGHSRDVRLQPDDIAGLALEETSSVLYRTHTNEDGYSDWIPVEAIGRPGGVFVYLKDLRETTDIQFKIEHGNNVYKSRVEPQWIKIDLGTE